MKQDTKITNAKQEVRQGAHEAEREARYTATSHWMVVLAKLGYIVNGIVYIIIGGLAAQLAIGHGGATTDQRGALRTIYEQPFGKVIVAIVALGLLGYALWSFAQAIFDTEGKGRKAKGIIARLGYAVTGISYLLLSYGAFQLVLGTGNGGNSSTTTTQNGTARLLQAPFGVALVVILGLAVIGLAGFFFYKAYSVNFRQHFNLSAMAPQWRKWAMFSGRLGYGALGIDFLLVGIFLVVAALQHDPHKAQGLDGALQTLLHQPFGPVLLAIVALGFIAYGIYSFVEARYRRMGRG
jgi:hypothetical protein